jgi:hypothetical protein
MSAESSSGTTRIFILFALAIVGLICIGLLGLSLALMVRQSNQAQDEVTPTPVVQISTPTPTPTITPIPPTPTNTPEPTPTATLVVNPNAEEVSDDQRPTEVILTANPFGSAADTPAAGTETPGTPIPEEFGSPTNTLVVETEIAQAPTTVPETTPGAPTSVPEVTPTNTLVVQTPTAVALVPGATPPPVQIPQGGEVLPTGNGYLLWAGVGVLLLLIWGLISYLRSPSSMSGR